MKERGAILVVVLWVVLALAMIAISFAASVREEVAAARGLVDIKQSYYYARAGISYSIYQIMRSRMMQATPEERLQKRAPDPVALGRLRLDLAGGFADVEVLDETGKLNINFVPADMLLALLINIGIPPGEADILVDSIDDWRDPDDEHRLNGAENEYYMSLEKPYLAKNTQVDVPEELLLIRGVTPEYFYGKKTMVDGQPMDLYGLNRYLTTFTNMNRINANSASIPVLMSIPGMDQVSAETIVRERRQTPFSESTDFAQQLPLQLSPNVMGLLSSFPSNVFSLVASGGVSNSRARSVIRCVFIIENNNPRGYRILYWNENNLEI